MRFFFSALLAGVICAAPALPDSIVATGKTFVLRCNEADGCDPDRVARHKARAAELPGIFEAAFDWLKSQGVPVQRNDLPSLRGSDGVSRYVIDLTRDGGCGAEGFACFIRPSTGRDRLFMPMDVLNTRAPIDATAAHELFHAMQRRVNNQGKWFTEATATAVGWIYAKSKGQGAVALEPPNYNIDLDAPFHRPRPPYSGHERGHFMYFAAEKLNGASRIDFLHNALLSNNTAEAGLRYVYGPDMGAQTYNRLFPEYVRLLNGPQRDSAYFQASTSDLQQYAFYRDITEERATLGGPAHEFSRQTVPYASDPVLLRITPEKAEPMTPRTALRWLNVQMSPAAPDVVFVAEHAFMPRGRYRKMILANGTPREAAFLRAVHVPGHASASAPRPYTARVYSDTVTLGLTGCVIAGQPYPLFPEADPADLEDLNIDIKATNATVQDFHVTPIKSGKVTLRITLFDTVTRTKHSIREVKKPYATLVLDDITASNAGCMIRLRFPDGGGYATYTPDGRYSEYVGDDGTRFFISDKDFAVWAPGEGWIDIPAEIKSDMAAQMFEAQRAMVGREAEMLAEDAHEGMHLPLAMAHRFSSGEVGKLLRTMNLRTKGAKSAARKAAKQDGGQITTIPRSDMTLGPAPCPVSGTGCRAGQLRLAGFPIARVVQNAQGHALSVQFSDTAPFLLDYGTFDIMRPPGF